MRSGISISVSAADRRRLETIVADRNTPQKHVWRARIVLLTADGLGTNAIMAATGKSKTCVWRCHDAVRAQAVGGKKDDPCAPDMLLRPVAIGDDGLQTPAIGGRDRNGYPAAHAANSHAPRRKGIPVGTPSFRSHH